MKDREVVPDFDSGSPDTNRQKITMLTNKKQSRLLVDKKKLKAQIFDKTPD